MKNMNNISVNSYIRISYYDNGVRKENIGLVLSIINSDYYMRFRLYDNAKSVEYLIYKANIIDVDVLEKPKECINKDMSKYDYIYQYFSVNNTYLNKKLYYIDYTKFSFIDHNLKYHFFDIGDILSFYKKCIIKDSYDLID